MVWDRIKRLFGGSPPALDRAVEPHDQQQIDMIAAMAQRMVDVVNESMRIAHGSKNIETRRSRMRVARERLGQVQELAAQYPFLKVERLAEVESDLAKIDQETDGLQAPEDSSEQWFQSLANDLINSINRAALIARDSKSIENRRSNVAFARHQIARLAELAEKYPSLKGRMKGNAERDLVNIDVVTDRLSVEYAAPGSNTLVRSEAFLSISLAKQCEALGIPLNVIEMERAEGHWIVSGRAHKRPEEAALAYFQEQGWRGAACEGSAVLILMKAACLDYLAEVNTFGSRQDACMRYFEAQCIIHRERSSAIVRAIERASESTVRANLAEIMAQTEYSAVYPRMNLEALIAIWRTLPARQLAKFAGYIFADPGNRAGWPDLTLARNNKIMFVEVKTTDKLHCSQRDVILGILQPNRSEVRVVKLNSR